MTEDFDKEMDSILRQAARQENFSAQFPAHVDAEEISLFAENALTSKKRQRVIEHLADCARCRKILSNVISLNSAEAGEIIPVAEKKIGGKISPIPWYRKIFAAPSLALSMGAMVILLGGILGFVLLQNSNSENLSVARIDESEQIKSSGPSPEATVSTSAVSNTSIVANTNSTGIAPQDALEKSRQTISNTNANPAVRSENNSVSTVAAARQSPLPTPSSPIISSTESADKNVEKEENFAAAAPPMSPAPSNQAHASAAKEQTVSEADLSKVDSQKITGLPIQKRSTQGLPAVSAKAESDAKDRKVAAKSMPAVGSSENESIRKTVGGKTFVSNQGVWYDTDYNQQPTKNVSRNSAEFKNLDSGIRTIASNLNGVVVLVWKNKAYRIQ